MPKHKKTREQKMKADERRTSLSTSMPTYSFSFSPSTTVVKQHTATVHTDELVRKDLQKTAIVSILILFLQIVLYLLLQHHVLAFSFVRY